MQDEIASHSEERETHRSELQAADEKIAVQELECEEKVFIEKKPMEVFCSLKLAQPQIVETFLKLKIQAG